MTGGFDTGQRFGAYELGKLLGRGGMGVVYQAQHVHLGRTVALKLLAPELSENEDFRARFLRESRMAAALDHPAIVTVYDAGDVNGVLYIAMRFVRGTDLSSLLDQRAPLGPGETVGILAQVADALDAAHTAGLVHRDVKPANVMIEGDRCYLADFGLTKRAMGNSRVLTRTGQFLGTVDYVAPEQIEGRDDVDGRADEYALGCVLFECLTGSRPYPRDSQVAVLYAQLREPPPRPTELRPDLPAAIDDVVMRAMSKSPAARYGTCVELVRAVEQALKEPAKPPVVTAPVEPPPAVTAPAARPVEPVTSVLPQPSTPFPSQASAPSNRKPWAIAGVLAALAVAGAIVAVVASSGGSSDENRAAAPKHEAPQPAGTTFPVGKSAEGVVFRDGDLWVASNSENSVIRVAPATGETSTIKVGAAPSDLASNTHGVWAANSGENSISRIDTISGKADKPIPVGENPLFLTAEDDAIYVSNNGSDTVSVIDPKTGTDAAPQIPVGHEPKAITTSPNAAWVTNSADGTVSRIVDNKVAGKIRVGEQPTGITYGGGAIWVANRGSDTVSRIDEQSQQVTNVPVGDEPVSVVFGQGSAWVANSAANSVMRLDPDTGKQTGDPIPVPGKPVSLTIGAGAIWVSANEAATLTRIQP